MILPAFLLFIIAITHSSTKFYAHICRHRAGSKLVRGCIFVPCSSLLPWPSLSRCHPGCPPRASIKGVPSTLIGNLHTTRELTGAVARSSRSYCRVLHSFTVFPDYFHLFVFLSSWHYMCRIHFAFSRETQSSSVLLFRNKKGYSGVF